MLMYYNDALSLAAQVLAPLGVLLEIVLANHEPIDEVEGNCTCLCLQQNG